MTIEQFQKTPHRVVLGKFLATDAGVAFLETLEFEARSVKLPMASLANHGVLVKAEEQGKQAILEAIYWCLQTPSKKREVDRPAPYQSPNHAATSFFSQISQTNKKL